MQIERTAVHSPELSVVMPCYNEAPLLEESLRDWHGVLEKHVPEFEIIVVNDGSKDGSGRILDRLRKELPTMRVLHQLNSGHERAVRRGYDMARGCYILQVDLSGRYDSAEFPKLWEQRTYHPLVLGARSTGAKKKPSPFLRRLMKFLYSCELKDPETPFRLFRRELVVPFVEKMGPGSRSVNLLMSALISNEHPDYVAEIDITYRRRPAFFRTQERSVTFWGRWTNRLRLLSELLQHRPSSSGRLALTLPTR